MHVNWSTFKTFITSNGASYFEVPLSTLGYDLEAWNGNVCRTCLVREAADVSDYETNYQAGANAQSSGLEPFASKQVGAKKLFRRVHGVKKTLSGDTTFDLVVPYTQCKINELVILWAPAGLQADLKVYDTPTGTISTVPNYMLNQFGFDAGVAKDHYKDSSNYDADLIQNMKVEVTLKNPNNATDEVCVNFILHELV